MQIMVAISLHYGNSYLRVPQVVANSYLSAMRPKDLRRNNLRLLVAEFGTIAEVARLSGASEKYLSQLLGEVEQQGTVRGMGDRTAEKLEDGCNKSRGWMDQDHSQDALPAPDAEFINKIRQELAQHEVPEHIKQTIHTLIASSPKKPA